jgi:hypothetical protein
MKYRSLLGFLVVVTALVFAGEFGLVSQWQETTSLRAELARLQQGAGELERLRAENRRLQAGQVSAAELAALPADHAELERLRTAVQQLKAKSQSAVDASARRVP